MRNVFALLKTASLPANVMVDPDTVPIRAIPWLLPPLSLKATTKAELLSAAMEIKVVETELKELDCGPKIGPATGGNTEK